MHPGSDADVFPADVTLYCGYAYESELIAQTARHLIPAALLFALGIFILMVFLWNVYYNRLDASLLLLALLAFNMMSRLILQAPFFSNYFGILPVDLTALCLYSSAALLLAFLTCQHTGRLRAAMFVITALQVTIVSFSTISEYQGHIHVQLCANATLSALLLAFSACHTGLASRFAVSSPVLLNHIGRHRAFRFVPVFRHTAPAREVCASTGAIPQHMPLRFRFWSGCFLCILLQFWFPS